MIVATPPPDAPAATLAASDAARMHWSAIVVGAGPAGAAAAWRLAGRGFSTLLLDRRMFPRPKVCGCCLSALAVRELDDLGPDGPPDPMISLDSVRLSHRGCDVRIPVRLGRVVSRTRLDGHLVHRAIAAGCAWLPGVEVTAVDEPGGDGRTTVAVVVRDGAAAGGQTHRLQADLVVLANGLAGHVRVPGDAPVSGDPRPRSRIGVGGVLPATACDLATGELVMAVAAGGYCGLVRLEDGTIDVAAAVDRGAIARDGSVARAIDRLLDEAADRSASRIPTADAILAGEFQATPRLTRRMPLVAGRSRRIFRVGDAAGYVEPFTGEGMGWALASARILAEAVTKPSGLAAPAEAASRYVALHRRQFAVLHARCRFVAGAVRRGTVVAGAVAAARTMPWAARILAPAVVGGPILGGHR